MRAVGVAAVERDRGKWDAFQNGAISVDDVVVARVFMTELANEFLDILMLIGMKDNGIHDGRPSTGTMRQPRAQRDDAHR